MSDLPDIDPLLGDLTGPDFSGMSEEDIIDYWRKSTIKQRLQEAERLRRVNWGRQAVEPVDKTKLQVVRLEER